LVFEKIIRGTLLVDFLQEALSELGFKNIEGVGFKMKHMQLLDNSGNQCVG